MTHDSLWAVMTLRAARFALGAESDAFGRTLNVRTSPPPSTVVDSAGTGDGIAGGSFVGVGGGGEIRTLEGLSPSPVFKTGAFNRSATPPQRGPILLEIRFQSTTDSWPEVLRSAGIAFAWPLGMMGAVAATAGKA